MELSVTLAQAQAIRSALAANATVLWSRDGADPTKAETLCFLDAKVGQLFCRFATEADKPPVAQVQAMNGQLEVASITG